MLKHTPWLILTWLLLGVSSVAQEYCDPALRSDCSWQEKVYVLGQGGWANSFISDDELEKSYIENGLDVDDVSASKSGMSWGLGLGYRLSPKWGAEVSYFDLGPRELIFSGVSSDLPGFYQVAKDVHPATATGLKVSGLYHYPLKQDITLSGRLGLMSWTQDYQSYDDGVTVAKDSDSGVTFSAGAEGYYQFRRYIQFYASTDLMYLNDQWVHDIAVGVRYYFGHLLGQFKSDADGDGVVDERDQCPETLPVMLGHVDDQGCPADDDGDEVLDYQDDCPDTDMDDRAYVNAKGCIADDDNDGVANHNDQCPSTPDSDTSYVDEKGCALDSDSDGVIDALDKCPDTPAAAKGYVDDMGCMLDSDNDKVEDYRDECPDTPEGFKVSPETGCLVAEFIPGTNKPVWDRDMDLIYNDKDLCDDTIIGTAVVGSGCGLFALPAGATFDQAQLLIQFETDSSVIQLPYIEEMQRVAEFMQRNPGISVTFEGHTDNVGGANYNKRLSERRAKQVANYMESTLGAEAARISVVGYGLTKPMAANDSKEGRALNRRVVMLIKNDNPDVPINQQGEPQPVSSQEDTPEQNEQAQEESEPKEQTQPEKTSVPEPEVDAP